MAVESYRYLIYLFKQQFSTFLYNFNLTVYIHYKWLRSDVENDVNDGKLLLLFDVNLCHLEVEGVVLDDARLPCIKLSLDMAVI